MAVTGRPSVDCSVRDAGQLIPGASDGAALVPPHAAVIALRQRMTKMNLFKLHAHLASEPPVVLRRRVGLRRLKPHGRLDADGNEAWSLRHVERHMDECVGADVD